MGFQTNDPFFERFLPDGVLGQRLVLERGEEFIPDGVELALHVAGVGRDRDDHILVGDHDYELTTRAVAAERVMGTAPELEAVALTPIDADLGV